MRKSRITRHGRWSMRFKNGYLVPFAKPRLNGSHLGRGLKTLNTLWEKGFFPKELYQHFISTWFCYYNCNASPLCRGLKLHRNTALRILRKTGIGKTYRERLAWRHIRERFSKKTFDFCVAVFYKNHRGKPAFSPAVNKDLVYLWLTGIPFEAIRPHFILWLLRGGKSQGEITKIAKIGIRTLHRIRYGSNAKGSMIVKWLNPLKPKMKDWYPKHKPRGYRKRKKNV